tara:strand:- start:80 stop:979 length:900 start_codon:yes stop_codon:yes gene_type:complete
MVGELTLKNDVEVFYTNVVKDADDEFCIDLDVLYQDETGEMIPIWQWSGYSTKEKAVYKTKKLQEKVDFLLHKDVKRTEGRGGNNKHQYLFTKDGFKQFLMLSNTARGRQIRLYFIDVEKRYSSMLDQPTPMDQTLAKLIGTFDYINNKLIQGDADQLVTNQILNEYEARHNKSDQRHEKTEIEVASIQKELTKLKSRKDPKKADKEACLKLVKSDLYRSFCPCCDQKTENFEIDHFYDSSKNHLSEIWPVCKPCNKDLGVGGDLKDGSFRKEKERNFIAFQQILQNQNRPKNIQKSLF